MLLYGYNVVVTEQTVCRIAVELTKLIFYDLCNKLQNFSKIYNRYKLINNKRDSRLKNSFKKKNRRQHSIDIVSTIDAYTLG